MRRILTAIGTAALSAAAILPGLTAAAAQDGPPDPAAMRRMMEERNKLPNTFGDGPYPARLGVEKSLPGHVVYRPADLSPFGGGKLPILIWGNGGCADDGTAHRFHLAEIASYGYLVVAAGHWRSGPGATDGPAPQGPRLPPGQLPPPATSAADVLAGLDWTIAENARPDSPLFGKVDTGKVAVAGHSCGGLQAIELAADPRIDTVLIHNSGVFNDEKSPIQSMAVSKAMLAKFHQPVIYILGGPTDIAFVNGEDDYKRVSTVPIMKTNLPVGHGGTFGEPMGGAVARVAVDWLEWQLRGDKVAGRTFTGENCRLCSGTNWSLERKGW